MNPLVGAIKGMLSGKGADLINSVGNVVDDLTLSKEEKEKLKLELIKLQNEHEASIQKSIAETLISEDAAITKRWEADLNSDNYLAKISRPVTLLSLLAFLYIIIIVDSVTAEWLKFDVKEAYIDLLQMLLITVVAAYFGSRGFEKYSKIKANKPK
jgi:hypothetical protein